MWLPMSAHALKDGPDHSVLKVGIINLTVSIRYVYTYAYFNTMQLFVSHLACMVGDV